MQNNKYGSSQKSVALRYVGYQAVLVGFAVLAAWGFGGGASAQSAFLAGAICVCGNTLFAMRIFRYRGAAQVRQFMWAFYTGELAKLALMVTLMVIVMATCEVRVLPFLMTFVLVQWLVSAAPLLLREKGRISFCGNAPSEDEQRLHDAVNRRGCARVTPSQNERRGV